MPGSIGSSARPSSSSSSLLRWQTAVLVSVVAVLVSQWLYAGSVPGDLSKSSIKNVLVLTAHPDDEVMFFAPAILSLLAAGVHVYGLCMSAGNADGLGHIRKHELVKAYETLGVPQSQVTLIDDPILVDGMNELWNPAYVATKTASVVYANNIDTILTFDAQGVSSHPNHIALRTAAWGYLARSLSRERQNRIATNELAPESGLLLPSVYSLRTPSLATKYLGLPMALYLHTTAVRVRSVAPPAEPAKVARPDRLAFLSSPTQYLRTLRAMHAHASQLVWFRHLYVLFSTLMFGGHFDRVEIIA